VQENKKLLVIGQPFQKKFQVQAKKQILYWNCLLLDSSILARLLDKNT
jgi:hypothetical protein